MDEIPYDRTAQEHALAIVNTMGDMRDQSNDSRNHLEDNTKFSQSRSRSQEYGKQHHLGFHSCLLHHLEHIMFIELELTVGRCVVLSDGDDSSSGSESDEEVNQAVVNLTGVLVRQNVITMNMYI